MRKFTLFIFFSLFVCGLIAQETMNNSQNKSEIKTKIKEEKESKIKKQFEDLYQILSDRSFVCEINKENFGDNYYTVNPMLNFIMVDSTEAMVQITQNNGSGINGFGGVTAKAPTAKYKLTKNEKRKSCNLTMIISTVQTGYFEVQLSISSSGNAYANCSYGFNGIYKFGFEGKIVKLMDSNVLKGQIR